MTELHFFKNKGVLIKPAGWFSWNQCCSEYLVECHNNVAHSKMLLKFQFGHGLLPNDVVKETQLIATRFRIQGIWNMFYLFMTRSLAQNHVVPKLGGGFTYFLFHPYLEMIPILTNICQRG